MICKEMDQQSLPLPLAYYQPTSYFSEFQLVKPAGVIKQAICVIWSYRLVQSCELHRRREV